MNRLANRLTYWAPRALGLAFAAFLSLFALDVFSMHYGFMKTALALFIHLIPTWIVLITLAIVWRREWIGALLFPLLAIVHLASMWGRLHWSGYAAIEAPLVLLGILFWLSWNHRAELRLRVQNNRGGP